MDQDRNELGWLTTSELSPIVLTLSSTLADAVAAFQLDTDMRLLPIVYLRRQPISAIFEKDTRRLLLNPFGHALLQNPTFSAAIAQHIRPCPAYEATDDMGTLVDHYQREDGREGKSLRAAEPSLPRSATVACLCCRQPTSNERSRPAANARDASRRPVLGSKFTRVHLPGR